LTQREVQQIPLVNLGRLNEAYLDELNEAMLEVVRKASFINGPFVERFEEAFATFVGATYAIGVASGTDAVHLALRGSGIGPGDEVITVANTFAATVEAIAHAGATPVLVDVDDRTLLMDPEATEAAITPRTRALLPVHLSGRPVDLGALGTIADRHGIDLIQDSAQAHGSTYQGRPLGVIGKAGAYSFFPAKNLGAFGDAGGIVTNDPDVAARVRSLRDHGRTGKYDHGEIGYGSRLDALQASVLSAKLAHLPEWNHRRTEVAERYVKHLADRVRIVEESPHGTGVFHHFVIRVPDRDRVREALAAEGVQTGVHYPKPIHLMEAFRFLGLREGSMPVSESAASDMISLPIDPMITDDEVDIVAAAVLRAAG
jgi:dTDP-4-amino-4,6-dideoxygalactose transaminase